MLNNHTKFDIKGPFMLNPDPEFKIMKLQGHRFICNKKPSSKKIGINLFQRW